MSVLRLVCGIAVVATLFVACGGGGEHRDEIYLAAVAGDSEPQLIARAESIQRLSWSPDGRTLTFVTYDPEGGTADVHFVDRMNPQDQTTVEIPGIPDQFLWARSGGKIAVTYFLEEQMGFGLVSREPSAFRELFVRQGRVSATFAWQDDDTVLVADALLSARRLTAYDATTGGSSRQEVDVRGSPILSSDGTMIAWHEYCERPDSSRGIWVYEVTSGESERIDGVCGLTSLEWSPDSSEIAYTAEFTTNRSPFPADGGLYVVDLSIQQARRVTNPDPQLSSAGTVEVGVEWLPDGRFRVQRDTAYRCDHCQGIKVLLVDEDGSDEMDVTDLNPHAVGKGGFAFVEGNDLRISLDGQTESTLFEHDDEWRFRLAEFSPDGEWIAFSRFHCGECTFP